MEIVTKRVGDLNNAEIAAWAELQREDPAVDSPLFRPEYALAVDAARGNVEVALLMHEGEPAGFFPFERDKRNIGRAVAWRLSDAHGVIVRRGVPWCPMEIVRGAGLRAWKFDHQIASQKAIRPFIHWTNQSPYIDLSNGFDVYRDKCIRSGTNLIRQTERKGRKLVRERGPLHFEYHTYDEKAFHALLQWKSRQLDRWRMPDVFRAGWVIDLLDSIRHIQTPGFSCALSALYSGDDLVAVHLGLCSHSVLCSWISSYSDEFRKYSPGTLLYLELMKETADLGIKRIDLGLGATQLKMSLASGSIGMAVGSVDRRPLVSTVEAVYQRFWHTLPTHKLRSFPPAKGALRFVRTVRDKLAGF